MYNTEQLISILDTAVNRSVEIQCACSPLSAPEAETADWEIIHKFNAKNAAAALEGYWQLREQIHNYQHEHQISGLIAEERTYQGKTIKAFSVHEQLISILGDKEVLRKQTPKVIEWWVEVTQGMELWHSPTFNREDDYRVSLEEILPLAPLVEWAEISVSNGLRTEIDLKLCWGEPDPYPESKWFCAINPLSSSVTASL